MTGLEALGMGMASAATIPPPLRDGGRGKKIVVLGAGLAGLTAAYELQRAGYQVSIVEARSIAGGRCQTARRGFALTELGGITQRCGFDEGLYFNHGPWRIPYHHRSTLHYIKTFGIPVELVNNDNDASYIYSTRGKGRLASHPVRKMEIEADIRGRSAEILAKVVQAGSLDRTFDAADKDLFLAYLEAEGYLTGLDRDYAGTSGRGWRVKPGAGLHPGAPSTPYGLLDILHSNAWKTLSSVPDWDSPRTMFQPVGGMDALAKAFVDRLPGQIHYETRVEKIRQSDKGVEVSLVDQTGARSILAADWCVCTIPLSVLKTIDHGFAEPFATAMNGASYHPVGKIGLQMKSRFWEEKDWLYGGHVYTDDDDISLISMPSHGWFSQKGILLGYYQGGGNAAKISALAPDQRTEMALAFGEKIFHDYRTSFESAISVAWHLIPYSLGGWAEWSDEARARDYPKLLQPDRRIYLAGEHLSYLGGWQAGAIESAWMQIDALHKRASSDSL
ncbi:flavin monoamine oxidase family protein [Gluconacetobacter azotocaptans]|uniref:flavin monoamine oxidase family protein n=1 Tax=Gluconacetobacter azotocaptans TaxID=142834 RepID=UPI001F03E07D|nr:flavin monoamine oxidase family protein [Gluconacetobacter azotocaptans]